MPDLPQAVADVAETAARLAPEAERERRLPAELVGQMAAAGVFRLCVPAAAGGVEAHPATLVQVVEEIARADGAAGWCAAIGATSGLLAGYLPPDVAQRIYADPLTISGGVFAPRGKATTEPGGFRVSGRWPFASGCQHCGWLMGGVLVDDDPVPRLMLAPASEFTIHDTWHTMGLRGTGSHDIELEAVHVPVEHSASLIADSPTAAGRLYAFPVFGLLAIAIGATSLGIARGALDDIVTIAGRRTPTGSSRTLAQRPTAQAEVAMAEARLRAARALLHETIDEAWQAASGGTEIPVSRSAALRLAATHAATTGAEVTQAAYRLGGGAAVYERSPLPRRFRDANTATQHMLVAPATWELTGRLLLGVSTDTAQL